MKYNLQQGKLKLQGLISSNNISKAIKLSKSLIKNNPDIDLLLTHAQLQLLNNDLKGCEITRKIISKKHHNDKSAHRVLANLFKEHGQYQVAIKEYEIALDNVPNDKSLYDELAALSSQIQQIT